MKWPETWSSATLGDSDLFELQSGLWTGKKPPFNRAFVIRNTNLADLGALDFDDVADLQVEARQLASRTLHDGDVIVERSGGGPRQPVGRVGYFVAPNAGIYSFSNFTSVVRIRNQAVLLPSFVAYYLLHIYNSGATIPLQRATTGLRNLDWGAYIQLPIPRAPIQEQERISDIMSVAKEAIRLEERWLQTGRELKQALLNELFPPEEERGENEDVQWVPLGELGRVGNGSTPLKSNAAYWLGGNIPWVTSAKVYDVTITKADTFVTPFAKEQCHLPLVKAGSVLIAITGQGKTLGHAAVTNIDTCVNQHIAYVEFTEDVNPHFVRLVVESRYEQLRAVAQGGGSTKGALTCGYLRTFRIPLVPRAEQDRIVGQVMGIESANAHHERKRLALIECFESLLAGFMTGTLPVDRISTKPGRTVVA